MLLLGGSNVCYSIFGLALVKERCLVASFGVFVDLQNLFCVWGLFKVTTKTVRL